MSDNDATTAAPTKRDYVVLQKRGIRFPKEPENGHDTPFDDEIVETYVPILGGDGKVRKFHAVDDEDAITQYCGDPVEIPGAFKAIAWRYWSGGSNKQLVTVTDSTPIVDE